jgi:hypothetical protein
MFKLILPADCTECGRPLRVRGDKTPGHVDHAAGGICINDYRSRTRMVATPDIPEEDVTRWRAYLDQYIAERRARGIPWCGLAPDPRTIAEERRRPGTHKHPDTWEEAAA